MATLVIIIAVFYAVSYICTSFFISYVYISSYVIVHCPSVIWNCTVTFAQMIKSISRRKCAVFHRSSIQENGSLSFSIFPMKNLEQTWGLDIASGSKDRVHLHFAMFCFCEKTRRVLINGGFNRMCDSQLSLFDI